MHQSQGFNTKCYNSSETHRAELQIVGDSKGWCCFPHKRLRVHVAGAVAGAVDVANIQALDRAVVGAAWAYPLNPACNILTPRAKDERVPNFQWGSSCPLLIYLLLLPLCRILLYAVQKSVTL